MKNGFALTPKERQARAEGKRHKPLRTFTEMAEEFGVTRGQLVAAMANHAGPKRVLVHRNATSGPRNSWYDPAEMRAWWAKLHA